MCLMVDAQKHARTTRQVELALLRDQDNHPNGLCSSRVCDTNVRKIVGATGVRRKTPHCCRADFAIDGSSAIPALSATSAHLIQYAPFHRLSDDHTIWCCHS